MAELRRVAGSQLDGRYVELFIDTLERDRERRPPRLSAPLQAAARC